MEDTEPEPTSQSVMSELDRTESAINTCFHRIETLEKSLKYRPMTNDEREAAEKQVIELKRILLRQETQLQSLRSSNRGSAVIAVVLIFLAFLTFGLYKMYNNVRYEDD